MKAVVDASVAIKWVVEEEGSEAAGELAGHQLLAPSLLLVECGNVLWTKARRGELEADEARERLAALSVAPVTLIPDQRLLDEAVGLALRLDHPVYDCLYLALAIQETAVVITADRGFLRAVERGNLGPFARSLE